MTERTGTTGQTQMRDLALGDLDRELTLTRQVLERVPDDRLEWRPHEKSWDLGSLATHVANLLSWQYSILENESFDFADAPPRLKRPENIQKVLDHFDRGAERVREALREKDDAALRATWTLRHGEHVVSAEPRLMALRTWGISHMIHHRAQLGVYLRLLDLPVPPTYGPTADSSA